MEGSRSDDQNCGNQTVHSPVQDSALLLARTQNDLRKDHIGRDDQKEQQQAHPKSLVEEEGNGQQGRGRRKPPLQLTEDLFVVLQRCTPHLLLN